MREVEPGDRLVGERARALAAGWVDQRHAASARRTGARGLDRLEHAVDQLVGPHAVGERVVGEHEPVAQHVGGEVADVVVGDVRAAAQQRERPRGLHEAERRARAGAELDQRLEVGEAVAARGGASRRRARPRRPSIERSAKTSRATCW